VSARPDAGVLHALSIDVEEYFQVANFRGQFDPARWGEVASRLDVGMSAVLRLLERHRAGCTFFFLGWVAERRPDWVRRVRDAGCEIASHGFGHAFLWDIGPAGLRRELERTEAALAAAGAERPIGFRASTFTLTRRTWWAFDVLAERGYRYDSSVHPVRHPTYGVPDFERGISRVRATSGAEIVEFPVTTLRALGRNWPVGGGGYFRLWPLAVTRAAVARREAAGVPAALYLHPWELDPGQPRVAAPLVAQWRHRVNLARTEPRLDALLGRFRFGSFAEVLRRRGEL
jgi:polysaccharide deacetylase family protein (PEP-CTERM system associated)